MKIKFPKTVEEIEKSEWFQKLNKPELVAGLERAAEAWLQKHGSKGKIGQQLLAALLLYRRSKAGNVLTPRNVAILTFSILYAVCPLDAVADIIPVIGWMDDIGILSIAFTSIIASMGAQSGKEDAESPAPATAADDTPQPPLLLPEAPQEDEPAPPEEPGQNNEPSTDVHA